MSDGGELIAFIVTTTSLAVGAQVFLAWRFPRLRHWLGFTSRDHQ